MSKTISLRRLQLSQTCSCRTIRTLLFAMPLMVSAPALAAGTLAGTDINNIAEASYETPSGTITIQSNTLVIKVDELLNVLVESTDAGDIVTAPGAIGNVQTFRVTNIGNGDEAFGLVANMANGGDDFDPTFQKIVIDSNNDGVYDPGTDTDYIAGTNEPVLAPDTSRNFFVITTTPNTVVNSNRAEVSLIATALTGSGAPGTSFAGAGQGGGNAVVGLTTAVGSDSGFLAVQGASVTLAKSATVVDPFGGNRPIPGAVITYQLVATIAGTGTLNNLVISDPVPTFTTYQGNSVTLEAAALTDAVDADAGSYDGTRISVAAGNVPAGQTRTVTFRTVIQ
jgi:uncharacterized repeat protein (TIGR01451 family)